MRQYTNHAVLLSLFTLAATAVPHTALGQDAKSIYQRSAPSVVSLMMNDRSGQPISLGSGFVVAKGLVVTNFHVIRGASSGQVKVIGSPSTYAIEGVVAKDPDRDLAVLKVSTLTAPILQVATSKVPEIGETIFAIGNPQGMEGTLSQGIVSGVRSVGESAWVQITAAISPGSSGGPVVGTSGAVVGVAVATLKGGQNLNFAVAARHIIELMSKLGPSEAVAVAAAAKAKGKETAADAIGGPGIDKVVASDIQCSREFGVGAFDCNFSVRNSLDIPVKNIRYLAIMRDGKGQPIDAREGRIAAYAVIRPGLALRTSIIDGRFSLEEETKRIVSKIEVRILAFEPVQ